MQLTPLQLECLKLGADKRVSFGCMIKKDNKIFEIVGNIFDNQEYRGGILYLDYDEVKSIEYGTSSIKDNMIYDNIEIIGHPIRYDRLCYLRRIKQPLNIVQGAGRNSINGYFWNNQELYNQTNLEYPEELQILVRDFLLSIQN